METMDELKKRLNSSSQYLQSNDMQVVEVKEGYAKVEMVIDEQILNVHGFVHGGALYSLADTAAEQTVSLSASVGIAQSSDPMVDIDALLQRSDQALYQAKKAGRSRYCVYR